MIQITIPLDDSATRLRELAQQRGESVEQTAQALLLFTLLPTLPQAHPSLPPDDPDGSQQILRLSGSIRWPDSEGTVNTTNEKIDRLLAAEAMNPHDEPA